MKLTPEQLKQFPAAQQYAQRIRNRGKRAFAEAYLNYLETMQDYQDDTAVEGLSMDKPSHEDYGIKSYTASNVEMRIAVILRGQDEQYHVADDLTALAAKMNPGKLGFSPKMAAIVGAVLGFDYGVRTARGHQLIGLSITSDGFVIATTDPISSGAFLCTAEELARNLALVIADAKLTADETKLYERLYSQHVKNWRTK